MHGYKWPINCTRTRTEAKEEDEVVVSLLFVSSHLAAHHHKTAERNKDFHAIDTQLPLYPGSSGGEPRQVRVRGHISGHARNNM